MDMQKQRYAFQTSALKLSNGYVLPEGKMTPNTLFVGGIDMKVEENEIRDFFARYGAVKEVKIITYRGGICKGYGFVYFSEDVDIQTIIEQQITFKGKKLKLGPAIMKERSSRSVQSPLIGPSQWVSPSPYLYCTCCPPGLAPSSPVLSGGGQYIQPYSFSSFPVVVPQVAVNYAQPPYSCSVCALPLCTHSHSGDRYACLCRSNDLHRDHLGRSNDLLGRCNDLRYSRCLHATLWYMCEALLCIGIQQFLSLHLL